MTSARTYGGIASSIEKTAEYRRKIGHIPHQEEDLNAWRAPEVFKPDKLVVRQRCG